MNHLRELKGLEGDAESRMAKDTSWLEAVRRF